MSTHPKLWTLEAEEKIKEIEAILKAGVKYYLVPTFREAAISVYQELYNPIKE